MIRPQVQGVGRQNKYENYIQQAEDTFKMKINKNDNKKISHLIDQIEDDIESIPQNIQEDVKDIEIYVERIPTDALNNWNKMMSTKYLINFFFIGIPYTLYCIFGIAYNLWFNIIWGDWWAQGNLWLLINTFYIIAQSIFSIIIIFEVPFIMKYTKFYRFCSFISAIGYNLIYFLMAIDWIYQIFYSDKSGMDSSSGAVDILFNMLISFNLIIHLPIVPMNFTIILKEILVQFYQLVTDPKAPNPEDRLQLGLFDIENGIFSYIKYQTNYSIFENIFRFLFRYNPADIFIENKIDEKHYYKNFISYN